MTYQKIKHLLDIPNLLCDLYDIREMAEYHEFGQLPKDLDGTDLTIKDLLDDAIQELEKFTDRELQDLGLGRSEIYSKVHGIK